MDKLLNAEYHVGQVVISKRGKDVGHRYVIIGFLSEKRLALADADKFNIGCPKPKNPKHVASTQRVINEVAVCVKAGKKINHGELCRFLESACEESKQRGRAANGK